LITNGPEPAVHVCAAPRVIAWLMVWGLVSLLVIPPAPTVRVELVLEKRVNAPAVLLNVTEWTFQSAFMSGVSRVEPAKMTSAVPLFATEEAGVQFGVLVQWSFPWLPFHVHVAAMAGVAASSTAMRTAKISPDGKLRRRANGYWINTAWVRRQRIVNHVKVFLILCTFALVER
jgi:hypothetical protein